MVKGISFIILCAGADTSVKKRIPKCLIEQDGKTIIEHNLSTIKDLYEDSNISYEIILGTGYKSNEILERVSHYKITNCENEYYESTGAAQTLKECLELCKYNNLIIINGDVLIDHSSISVLSNNSYLVEGGDIPKNKIGINVKNNNVIGFNYKSIDKWGQIAYLGVKEFNILKEIKIRDFWCIHEVIKSVMDNGGSFKLRKSFVREVNY